MIVFAVIAVALNVCPTVTVPDDAAVFVISVAATLAGMHPQTLRQYDRLGLVSPGRTPGRGRRYSARDIAMLREVQRLSQDEGINLAGVKRIVMVSFLRARPNCGSGYHETKWAAEEMIRQSGIDHTILKASMMYGHGDHMVDHVSRAVKTWPIFGTVGYRESTVRPIPINDFVDVMLAAAQGRILEPTVAVMGAEELPLGEAVRRIADVVDRHPLFIAVPVWSIRLLAQLTEWLMVVPLVAKSQARMLAEGVSEPAPWAPELPVDIRPSHRFTDESIRDALPNAGRFGWSDLRVARWLKRSGRDGK